MRNSKIKTPVVLDQDLLQAELDNIKNSVAAIESMMESTGCSENKGGVPEIQWPVRDGA